MPNRAFTGSHTDSRAIERLGRRIWPTLVSVVYCALGLAYFFRWGPLVRHIPSQWITPGDLLTTYGAAIAFAHGHFSAIYQSGAGFLAYPGILIVLAPFTAISAGSFVQIGLNHHLLAHPQVAYFDQFSNLTYLGPTVSHGKEVVFHPQAFVALAIVTVVMSCTALFACDALAERLQVLALSPHRARRRRGCCALERHGLLGPPRGCARRGLGRVRTSLRHGRTFHRHGLALRCGTRSPTSGADDVPHSPRARRKAPRPRPGSPRRRPGRHRDGRPPRRGCARHRPRPGDAAGVSLPGGQSRDTVDLLSLAVGWIGRLHHHRRWTGPGRRPCARRSFGLGGHAVAGETRDDRLGRGCGSGVAALPGNRVDRLLPVAGSGGGIGGGSSVQPPPLRRLHRVSRCSAPSSPSGTLAGSHGGSST